MNTFRAYRIHRIDGRITPRFDQVTLDDLTSGEVVVRVSYSRHQLQGRIGRHRALRRSCASIRSSGGIDLAGEVVSSADPRYTPGQKVLVTGCGLSETHDGGYAEFARREGRLRSFRCRDGHRPNWTR